jgi:nucleotide-binding universal stress UspA family protein
MKKILIAIDYAPSAQKVAEKGYEIGKALNAKITLLHVIEDTNYYASVYDPIMGFGGFNDAIKLNADVSLSIEKYAKQFLTKTTMHLEDNEIHTSVLHGDITDNILGKVQKEHFDMIVLGTKSKGGIEEFFLGSTAHKIIKHSTVPIYIIPTKSS